MSDLARENNADLLYNTFSLYKLKNILKLCLILFISFYTTVNKLVVILNSKIEQKVKQLCQDSPPFNDLKNHSFVFLPRM